MANGSPAQPKLEPGEEVPILVASTVHFRIWEQLVKPVLGQSGKQMTEINTIGEVFEAIGEHSGAILIANGQLTDGTDGLAFLKEALVMALEARKTLRAILVTKYPEKYKNDRTVIAGTVLLLIKQFTGAELAAVIEDKPMPPKENAGNELAR